MTSQQCTGNPTFNQAMSENAYSEWPANILGYICKTPPVGAYSSARFAKCCSGTVYNITQPTNPDDPAYPMSCALFCQVDPAFDTSNDKYPYGFSDYYMCLTNGLEDPDEGEVVCGTNVRDGEGTVPEQSFTTTPTGSWQTQSYSLYSFDFRASSGTQDSTATDASVTTAPSTSSTSAGETTTTGEDVSAAGPSITSSSASDTTLGAPETTTTPNGATRTAGMGFKTCMLGAMLVLSVLTV